MSSAATFTAQNQNATDFGQSRVITDSLGNTLSSGYGAIGYFTTFGTTMDFSNASGADLEADFNILGSATNSFNTPGDGIFQIVGSDQIVAGGTNSQFINRLAVIIIGNASSLALSTEAFIYATGVNFAGDPAQLSVTVNMADDPVTNDFNSSNGSLLLGRVDGTGNVAIGGTVLGTVNNAFQTAVLVPEPSTLLLSAFGVLGLLRRKR